MNAMHRGFRWVALASLALATVVLSGCATSRNIESEVRSFGGTVPIAAGATYRFERLPSQDTQALQLLEDVAQKVLAAKGLVLADTKASYSVQVQLTGQTLMPDAMTRWANSPFPDRVVIAPDGSLWRQVRRPLMDPTWYRYTLQVVLRDLTTGSVAYETRAVHYSPWSDAPNLIAPLLEAALSDFPRNQPQPKTVSVVLPATSPSKP